MESTYTNLTYLLCRFSYHSLYLIYIINCYEILNIYTWLYKCTAHLYNSSKRIKLVINECAVCKKTTTPKQNKIKKKKRQKEKKPDQQDVSNGMRQKIWSEPVAKI